MGTHLKKLFSQHNTACRFQLEHELATIHQDSLSISDFYSCFINLWAEISVQSVHEISKKDQFLIKLRPKFEGTRSNLMNERFLPWTLASMSCFVKNNIYSLKPPWNSYIPLLFPWLMLLKESQEGN